MTVSIITRNLCLSNYLSVLDCLMDLTCLAASKGIFMASWTDGRDWGLKSNKVYDDSNAVVHSNLSCYVIVTKSFTIKWWTNVNKSIAYE